MLEKILFCDCRLNCKDILIYEIIKDLTGSAEILVTHDDNIKWDIKTKYYETTVSIDIRNHTDFEVVDFDVKYPAVIFLSEGKNIEIIDKLWRRLCQISDIRLLVTSESEINPDVQDWCLKNEFELIELYESCCDDALEDEIWGWRRIKSALEAHDWCNLVSDSTSDDEREADQFEQLLEQLGDIKDRLEGTSSEERIRLAEEVTLKFWRSMGGSESEINDL